MGFSVYPMSSVQAPTFSIGEKPGPGVIRPRGAVGFLTAPRKVPGPRTAGAIPELRRGTPHGALLRQIARRPASRFPGSAGLALA